MKWTFLIKAIAITALVFGTFDVAEAQRYRRHHRGPRARVVVVTPPRPVVIVHPRHHRYHRGPAYRHGYRHGYHRGRHNGYYRSRNDGYYSRYDYRRRGHSRRW